MANISVVYLRENFKNHKLETVFEQFQDYPAAQLRKHALMQLGIRAGIFENRTMQEICTVAI